MFSLKELVHFTDVYLGRCFKLLRYKNLNLESQTKEYSSKKI